MAKPAGNRAAQQQLQNRQIQLCDGCGEKRLRSLGRFDVIHTLSCFSFEFPKASKDGHSRRKRESGCKVGVAQRRAEERSLWIEQQTQRGVLWSCSSVQAIA